MPLKSCSFTECQNLIVLILLMHTCFRFRLYEMIKSNKSEMVLKVILTKKFVVRINASNENQK